MTLKSAGGDRRGDRHFRVIDTGIRDGRANIAFDRALIEARKAGEIPDTIRFLRFRPAAPPPWSACTKFSATRCAWIIAGRTASRWAGG